MPNQHLIDKIEKHYPSAARPWISLEKSQYSDYLGCCLYLSGVPDCTFSGQHSLNHQFISDKYSLLAEFGYAFRGHMGYMGRCWDGLWDCLGNSAKSPRTTAAMR